MSTVNAHRATEITNFPRRAPVDPWQRAGRNTKIWSSAGAGVTIDRIKPLGGDRFRVDFSDGQRLVCNRQYLADPATIARRADEICKTHLNVPGDVETVSDWNEHVDVLIATSTLRQEVRDGI